MESKLRMQRLILAEKGVATNQCCAVFPWTEFYNSIGGRPDVARRWSELLLLAEAVEKVGADRFCATIVLVGWA